MPKFRVAGVNLGGEATLRTSVAVFEASGKNRLELIEISSKIGSSKKENPDDALSSYIMKMKVKSLALNAPISISPCLSCKISCPGVKGCSKSQVKYLNKLSANRTKNKRYLPYIHRPADAYIRSHVDASLPPSDPMGANMAPRFARAIHIIKLIEKSVKVVESYPKLSLLMLRKQFGLLKNQAMAYSAVPNGKFYRAYILEAFEDKFNIGVKTSDRAKVISTPENFSAFVLGYVAALSERGETQKRPQGFPKGASWISFPIEV